MNPYYLYKKKNGAGNGARFIGKYILEPYLGVATANIIDASYPLSQNVTDVPQANDESGNPSWAIWEMMPTIRFS